jgi:hypothetical protein
VCAAAETACKQAKSDAAGALDAATRERDRLRADIGKATAAAVSTESDLSREREARTRAESELTHEREAKAKLDAELTRELTRERDSKVKAEAELARERDGKLKAETELATALKAAAERPVTVTPIINVSAFEKKEAEFKEAYAYHSNATRHAL